ncbi:MAG: glycosyltransferase [Euryarchaeota archaeon]|nr:glycosyltransferase [Euryarchaeota archaeon]
MSEKITLSIIMPVYNEENTILESLRKIKFLEPNADLEIIVINDGSTDKTKTILEKNSNLYNTLINLKNNYGKGKAVIEGLKKSKSKYIVFQDADLEYDPKDLKKFIIKVENLNADLVMGSRFIGDERSVLHFWHMLGNRIITLIFNFLNNTTFSDIYCCYMLFKKSSLNVDKLKSFKWGQQAEILTYVVNKSKKIYEIGVSYNARNYKDGKKIRYYDVFNVIFQILLTRIKVIFS